MSLRSVDNPNPLRLERVAAIALIAAVAAAAIACGAGDSGNEGDASSATPGADSTPSATADASQTPVEPVVGVTDLSVDRPAMTIFGRRTDDLLTGATNVALGDFNDDGQPDLLMGAPQADGPGGQRPDAGEAYVFFGPLQGEVDLLNEDPDITIYGASGTSEGGDGLGFSVFSGDLDDDGVDDVMVGAPGVTAGFDPRTDQGRLYVFYGRPDLGGITSFDLAEDEYDLTVTGSEGFSRLSTDVDLGDFNGDGRTDLLVSSPYAGRAPGTPPGSARTAEGEIYVKFGTGDRLTGELNMAADDYDVLLGGNEEFSQFGASFAVGDFNGDGFDDVLTGAHRSTASDGRPSAGAAYVFLGRDDIRGRHSVLDDAQDMSIGGANAGSALGLPVAAGDFNGDGFDDLAIGAQSEGIDNLATAGALRIFFGADDLPSEIDVSATQAGVLVPGSAEGVLQPSALAVGDTNGDGVDDLIFSSVLGGATQGRSSAGLIYVIRGADDLPTLIDIDAGGLQASIIGAEGAEIGAALSFGPIGNGQSGLAVLAPGVSLETERPDAGAVMILPMRTT